MSKEFKTKINDLSDLKNLNLNLDKNSIPKNKKLEIKDDGASGIIDLNDSDKNDFKNLESYLRFKNRKNSLVMKKDVKKLVDGILENNKKSNQYKEKLEENSYQIKRRKDNIDDHLVYDSRYPGGIAPNNKNGYNPIKKDEIFFSKKDEKDEKDEKGIYLGKDFDKKITSLGAKAREKIEEKIEESTVGVNKDFDKRTEYINLEIRDRLLNEIKSHKLNLDNLYSLEKNGIIDSDHVNINRVKESLNKAETRLKEVEQRLRSNLGQDDISSLDKGGETFSGDKKIDYSYRKEQLENSVEKEINELKEKIISNKRNIDYLIKKDGENHENVINERNNLKNNESRLKELENWEDFDVDDSYFGREKIEKVKSNIEKAIEGVEAELEKINNGKKTRPKKEISDLKRSLFGFNNLFKKRKKKKDGKKENVITQQESKLIKEVKKEESVNLEVDNKEESRERELLLNELDRIKNRRFEIRKRLGQINSLKGDIELS